jgi:hypothetical protein
MKNSPLKTFQIILLFVLLANVALFKQPWITYSVLALSLVSYVIRLREIPKGQKGAALLPTLVGIALVVVIFLIYRNMVP